MPERFASFVDAPHLPSRDFYAVTPSDSNDLTLLPKALYVGTGGAVIAQNAGGTAITFKNVANGQVLDIRANRVLSTGTTAADIVALV